MQTVLFLKQRRKGHSVAARIFQTAKERLLEIWDYTERTWGEEQADKLSGIWLRRLIMRVMHVTRGGPF
jgi:hypothetical protein